MLIKPSYAGIGSRTYDAGIEVITTNVAAKLHELGYHLNSGGAEFSDTLHEDTYILLNGKPDKDVMSVFLPWDGFNGRNHNPNKGYYAITRSYKLMDQAQAIAAAHHPNWNNLKDPVKLLHTRNVLQVLGADLETPVKFVVCYTPTGTATGGTAQAIRIARHYNIPVYNLKNPLDLHELCEELEIPI